MGAEFLDEVVAVTKVDQGHGHLLHLRCRRSNGERVTVTVIDHEPFFYASEGAPETPGIVKRTPGAKSLFGQPLVKYSTRTPSDVGELRQFCTDPHEADVPYTQRAVLDLGATGMCHIIAAKVGQEWVARCDDIKQVSRSYDIPLHIGTFDIETTYGSSIYSMLANGKNEILSISLYDEAREAWNAWLYHPLNPHIERLFELNKMGSVKVDVRVFARERAMLEDFGLWMQRRELDALCGWNSKNFDAPYVIRRCDRIGIRRPFGQLGVHDASTGEWPGVQHIDLLPLHRRASKHKMKRNRLLDVSRKFLGVELEKEEGQVTRFWHEDPHHLLEYNLRDVEATHLIGRTQGYIDLGLTYQLLSGVDRVTDVNGMLVVHDVNFLRLAMRRGVVLPMKPAFGQKEKKYKGAMVIEPVPGIHQRVANLDFTSLYPTSQIVGNLSPEMYCVKEGCTEPHFVVPDLGHKFHTREEGIVPEAARLFFEQKSEFDRRMKASQGSEREKWARMRWASKIMTNGMYGATGNSYFRLFHRPVAESTAAIGRHVAIGMVEGARRRGYTVTLADTDSVYTPLRAHDPDAMIEEGRALAQELAEDARKSIEVLGGRSAERLNVEFDKVYDRLLATRKKKRYAGTVIVKDGKPCKPEMDIVGFDAVRSDAPDLSIDLQTNVLNDLLGGKDPKEVSQKVAAMERDVRLGRMPLADVCPTPEIGEELEDYGEDSTYYVKTAAEFSNRFLGEDLGQGDRPYIVFVDRLPHGWPRVTTIAVSDPTKLPKGVVVNWKHHAQVAVTSKMKSIFEAVGLHYKTELVGTPRLSDFFG